MIDLSIKHRKHDMLNESLKTYKKICEKHNFESLFNVFNHYITILQKYFNTSLKHIENHEEMF